MPPPPLCCFPLITDLLAVEVYQAHKSKQDRGPDWGRALYTGRALILSGLENKLQFRQLPARKSPARHGDALPRPAALAAVLSLHYHQSYLSLRPVKLQGEHLVSSAPSHQLPSASSACGDITSQSLLAVTLRSLTCCVSVRAVKARSEHPGGCFLLHRGRHSDQKRLLQFSRYLAFRTAVVSLRPAAARCSLSPLSSHTSWKVMDVMA